MSPEALARLKEAAANLAAPVTLLVRPGPEAAQTERALAFARQVRELAPGSLTLAVAEEPDPEGATLGLARPGGRVPVRFRVVPEKLELEVFAAALAAVGGPAPESPLTLARPLSVEVMTLPLCTHCAPVATALCRLAAGCERLATCVIDLQQAPQYIQRYSLTATPAVIVNERTFARGRSADELSSELAAIADGEHERFALALRLEAGEAAAVARECLARSALPPGLCSLVAAQNFQTRLGAIVALQEIAAASMELARQAAAQVAPLLADPDPRNRGDAAYILGCLGCPEAAPLLERLLSDPDLEVASSAAEALAALRQP